MKHVHLHCNCGNISIDGTKVRENLIKVVQQLQPSFLLSTTSEIVELNQGSINVAHIKCTRAHCMESNVYDIICTSCLKGFRIHHYLKLMLAQPLKKTRNVLQLYDSNKTLTQILPKNYQMLLRFQDNQKNCDTYPQKSFSDDSEYGILESSDVNDGDMFEILFSTSLTPLIDTRWVLNSV